MSASLSGYWIANAGSPHEHAMWLIAASRRRTISGHPPACGSIGAPIVTVMGA
jgi:hypothetical protein